MKNRHIAIIAAVAGALLAGCSSQSKTVNQPVWVSSNINGLQGSPCHCGGVLPKKVLKAQEKARRKAEKGIN